VLTARLLAARSPCPCAAAQALFMRLTSELFANGELVSRGYVDDPRNTDNAWMETSVFHFHCSNELGKLLPLHAGDDAAAVMWLDIDPTEPKFNHLYASHKDFINRAVEQFGAPPIAHPQPPLISYHSATGVRARCARTLPRTHARTAAGGELRRTRAHARLAESEIADDVVERETTSTA
jgi:hypothetical protein